MKKPLNPKVQASLRVLRKLGLEAKWQPPTTLRVFVVCRNKYSPNGIPCRITKQTRKGNIQ